MDYIHFSGIEKNVSVRILNTDGRIIQSFKSINPKNGILVQDLPKGNYLLEIVGKDTIKFLKL